MVAIQDEVPVVPIAVYGTQFWKPLNFAPCSIAVGEPFRFEGIPKGGKGYKEASARDRAPAERPLRLARRRPRPRPSEGADPAAMSDGRDDGRQRRRRPARHGRDRRLPERRQVDADQPADLDAGGRRPRDERDDPRPQGARLRVGRQAVPARSTPAASTSRARTRSPARSSSRRGSRSARPTSCCSSSTPAPA